MEGNAAFEDKRRRHDYTPLRNRVKYEKQERLNDHGGVISRQKEKVEQPVISLSKD